MKKLAVIILFVCLAMSVFAEDVHVSLEEHIAYPESWSNMTNDEMKLNLLNILTRISTQKGLQYISRMAGYKPKTLFEDSYCITDLEKKKSETNDPKFDSLVDSYRLYAYQKDNRFGGNTYTIDYTVCDDAVSLKIVNHTAMRFAGVTCVKPECLTMTLSVKLSEGEFVINGDAFVPDQKAKINLLFYTVDLDSSFERRITAMKNWFIDQLKTF